MMPSRTSGSLENGDACKRRGRRRWDLVRTTVRIQTGTWLADDRETVSPGVECFAENRSGCDVHLRYQAGPVRPEGCAVNVEGKTSTSGFISSDNVALRIEMKNRESILRVDEERPIGEQSERAESVGWSVGGDKFRLGPLASIPASDGSGKRPIHSTSIARQLHAAATRRQV